MIAIYDLDGCLIGGGSNKEERRARDGIAQLIESQDLEEAIVCTGRGPEFGLAIAKMFGIKRGITAHGRYYILDAEDDIIIENPNLQNTDPYVPVELFEQFLRKYGGRLYLGNPSGLTGYPPQGMSPKELYEHALDELRDIPGQFIYSDRALDWTPANLTKGSSLLSFVSTFAQDIDLSNCFGIGDSLVDVSWLRLLRNRIAGPHNRSTEIDDLLQEVDGFPAQKGFAQGTLEATEYFIANWSQYSLLQG